MEPTKRLEIIDSKQLKDLSAKHFMEIDVAARTKN